MTPAPFGRDGRAQIGKSLLASDGGEMANVKQPLAPALRLCSSCHLPQTKIQRVLGSGKLGSISYVCSRPTCSLSIDLSKLDTWVAV